MTRVISSVFCPPTRIHRHQVYNRAEYGKAISVYSRLSDEHPNINCIVDKVVEQTKVYAFYNPGQPMMNQEKSKGSS